MAELEELAGRDVIEYLRHGFNLYDELVRNSFTDDVALAELAVIRCEEFVCGLSLFYHAVPWPEDVFLCPTNYCPGVPVTARSRNLLPGDKIKTCRVTEQVFLYFKHIFMYVLL